MRWSRPSYSILVTRQRGHVCGLNLETGMDAKASDTDTPCVTSTEYRGVEHRNKETGSFEQKSTHAEALSQIEVLRQVCNVRVLMCCPFIARSRHYDYVGLAIVFPEIR
jgi:hypothetical protein